MNQKNNIMKYMAFCEEKTEIVQHVSKNSVSVFV
jgi:hypothetical protein